MTMKTKNLIKNLSNGIDNNRLTGILVDLVSTPSHLNCNKQEYQISNYVLKLLKKEGIDTFLQKVEQNRFNVIARIPGNGDGKSLTLNGHLDTVPPNHQMVGYTPKRKGDRIYGLGTSDMKGAVAAMLYSLILIKRMDIKLAGDLYFTGVVGEETGGTGTRFLMESGFKSNYFIVGEPTELKIANSHKGCYLLDVIIYGKAAHASMPEKGCSAIEAMAELITLLKQRYIPILSNRKQENVGNASINYGLIQGGNKVNIVADRCTLSLDRRWINKENMLQLKQEIEGYVKEICDLNKNLHYELVPKLPQEGYFGPFYMKEDSPIMGTIKRAYQNLKIVPEVTGMQGWTDGATIAHHGFPTLIIGPGSMSRAHSAEEFITGTEVEQALKVYLSIICETCINEGGVA